jgi:hypothetical protein
VFIIASLTLAVSSITLDRLHPGPDSWFCRAGFCRMEQISEVSAPAAGPASFASAINEDASDPYLWSAYADSLAAGGDIGKASGAMDHAVSLGPNLPPVLIRAAYFDFTHGRYDRGAGLSAHILSETSAFDPLVFSYLEYFGKDSEAILGTGIPAARRPAQAWAAWIGANGSEEEARKTWAWMMQNHLMDQPAALDLTWKLWRRQFFGSARELWSDWVGNASGMDPAGELVFDNRFEEAPDGSPFDWSIQKQASVEVLLDHGLEIHFLGGENVKLDGIRQSIIVRPGRYHFSAIIQSDDLTTDQGPFFRVFDTADSGRVDIRTIQITGTTPRSAIECEVVVTQRTKALTIQLERSESDRFDSKITGSLHIYEVSLKRSDR